MSSVPLPASFPLSLSDLAGLPLYGGEPEPASPAVIAAARHLLGGVIPDELGTVLELPGSPCMAGQACEYLLNASGILRVSALFPEWRSAALVPLGGDGCGNYFALHRGPAGTAVVFVEPMLDAGAPQYAVASDVEHFIEAVLQNRDWFDAALMRELDPRLLSLGLPLPWTA